MINNENDLFKNLLLFGKVLYVKHNELKELAKAENMKLQKLKIKVIAKMCKRTARYCYNLGKKLAFSEIDLKVNGLEIFLKEVEK